MHTRLIAGLLLVMAVVVVEAQPASADPWVPPSSGGGAGGGGFNAWAYWVSATGGGGTSTPESCDDLKEYYPDGTPVPPAHIEYVAYEIPPGSGQFSVWKDCVRDGYTVNPDLPNGLTWLPLDNWQVEASDPQELINQALAHIQPTPPAIGTSPTSSATSLVGIGTWLWLNGGLQPTSATITDGPLAVTVTATPVSVSWDTGDGGAAVCRDTTGIGAPGTDACSHVYQQSSADQAATDAAGRPAFTITASIEYTGSYGVSLNGVNVGGQQNIGGASRTSITALAVSEAQAINTEG
jgi:hypothetical protein